MRYFSKSNLWLLLAISLIYFNACRRDPTVQPITENLIPDYFPPPVYQFKNNSKSESKFQLGRMLFYDPILSIDSTVSCAHCHDQAHAFADHNVRLSVGVNGTLGKRNSPVIFNVLWQKEFMADGGINHIEIMPLAPLTDPLEMNNPSMSDLITRLNGNAQYRVRFKAAFDKDKIDDQQMFFALAQYMASLNSYQSRYDEVRQNKSKFTDLEEKGYALFKAHCNACHTEPLFTDLSYRNNGLDSIFTDQGRFKITQKTEDMGKFKVPTLRNINLTYPYMHDGRLRNLDDVLNHYLKPKNSATLDKSLENGIQLSETDKTALIAFLHTLSDYTLLSNPKLSKP